MSKQYNNLNDVEKYIIREYISWKNSIIDECIKIAQLEYWYSRAKAVEIEHLLLWNGKNK